MISVNKKGIVKLKSQAVALIKTLKQENFKEDVMNLIETNHHINMTSDHYASSNNSFQSFLKTKSSNMFLTL